MGARGRTTGRILRRLETEQNMLRTHPASLNCPPGGVLRLAELNRRGRSEEQKQKGIEKPAEPGTAPTRRGATAISLKAFHTRLQCRKYPHPKPCVDHGGLDTYIASPGALDVKAQLMHPGPCQVQSSPAHGSRKE